MSRQTNPQPDKAEQPQSTSSAGNFVQAPQNGMGEPEQSHKVHHYKFVERPVNIQLGRKLAKCISVRRSCVNKE